MAEAGGWYVGLRAQDAVLAIGDVLGSSRCWCDDCNGATEHDGTCAVRLDREMTDAEILTALTLATKYGASVAVVTGRQGHRGCGVQDDGEILIADATVISLI